MVDFIILLVLALAVLAGYYRGVIYSAINLGLTVLAFFLALACIPIPAKAFKSHESVYKMMLYYFEGYEYVCDTSVELVHVSVADVDGETMELIVENADMPAPMDRAVKKNVASAVYERDGIQTLGDYFNQTIVDVVINILSLLLLFLILRLFMGFVLRTIDYGSDGLPVLQRFDPLFSCGIGFLHGILLVWLLFMLVPVFLTIVPQLSKFIDESLLGSFFYRINPFLGLVPTT